MSKTPWTRNRDPKTGRLIKGGGWGYKIKYEDGKPLYKIGKDWVKRHKVPEHKEHENSVERYFQHLYEKIKSFVSKKNIRKWFWRG